MSSLKLSPRPVSLALLPSAACIACSTADLPLPLRPLITLTCVLQDRQGWMDDSSMNSEFNKAGGGGCEKHAAPGEGVAVGKHTVQHMLASKCLLSCHTATDPPPHNRPS